MTINATRFILLFGGLQSSASGSDQDPYAPSIEWDGDETDSRPDFDVITWVGLGAPYDTAVDDVLRIEYSANGGSSWNAYLTHTFTSGDIAGTPFSVSGVSALANGDYLFRDRDERGSNVSSWSSSESVTIDADDGDDDYAAWMAAA